MVYLFLAAVITIAVLLVLTSIHIAQTVDDVING